MGDSLVSHLHGLWVTRACISLCGSANAGERTWDETVDGGESLLDAGRDQYHPHVRKKEEDDAHSDDEGDGDEEERVRKERVQREDADDDDVIPTAARE